jgi:predicted GNAT superfamily acetyltransferase
VEARISLPRNIADLRRDDPARARDIQSSVADQFTEHFRADLTVIGFERGEDTGTYLLGHFEDRWESK